MLISIDSEMPKQDYSILIIGINSHPSHLIRFIRNLKYVNPSVRISLLTNWEPARFPEEIHEILVEFFKWRISSRWNWSPFINRLINRVSSFLQIQRFIKTRNYDIINIHYPQSFLCHLMSSLKKISSSIVISPWGSDVLRLEGKRKRRELAKVFQKADYITVGQTGNIGKAVVNEMKVDKSHLHPLAWGSETIDYINDHLQEVSTNDAKEKLGLGNRYVITCGYNAFEEQRHEIMIHAIQSIESHLPKDLVLLFPVTYGYSYGTRKKEYVDRLKELCEKLNLDAVFYENYLSVSELFLLRQATDMFIHIQTTDGGNSSLQEYVLCGKKVVHGSWMHYTYLEQFKPLFYFPVDDLNCLDEVIVKAYNSECIETPVEVMNYIRNRGWKEKMRLWDAFFSSIC